MKNRKFAPDGQQQVTGKKTALHNRAAGLAIVLFLFVLILYIATYAKLSG